MWYGLKQNGTIIQVRFFDHYPHIRDFDVLLTGRKHTIVVVLVREVCKLP